MMGHYTRIYTTINLDDGVGLIALYWANYQLSALYTGLFTFVQPSNFCENYLILEMPKSMLTTLRFPL
jgi:hypothetical protein